MTDSRPNSKLRLALLVLLGSCGRTELDTEPFELSISPTTSTVDVGERQRLRALTSTTEPVRFEWQLRTRPSQSVAKLTVRADGAEAELQPDVAGLYAAEVTAFRGASKTGPALAVVLAVPADAGALELDAGLRPDAGSDDAGTFPDAGSLRDAGRSDAGTDAGQPSDAGMTLDGGRDGGFDAGATPDAGSDAGMSVPLTDGGLDPNEVYLMGTLSEGTCGLGALAHWSTPNVGSAGFGCYFNGRQAVIRPSDRRLLYFNTFENLLREFHEDGPASVMYPTNVLANDRVIPTPPCNTVVGFLVAPDGVVLHQCSTDLNPLRDETGTLIFNGVTEEVLAVGPGRVLLTTRRVIDTGAGVSYPITWPVMLAQQVMTVRWQPPSSFLVALQLATPTLWEVQTNGTATQRGAFSPLPAQVMGAFGGKLDGSGRLFQQGRDATQSFIDVIIRREVGGTTSVVYSEAMSPLIRLHSSDLLTGP